MNHTATLLADGRVLIAGGSRMKGSAVDYLSSAELFDPKTGKFAKTGSLAAARAGHTATLLADGRVLIAGGYGWRVSPCTGMCSNTEELVSAELYDPKTGKFSKARPMSFPLAGHDATRLQDGRVLLIGGFYELVGELYDLTTGRFTALALPGMFGTGHAAVLADGRVFVVAGLGSCVAGLLSPDSGVLAPITRRPGACPDSAITVADGRVALFESGFVETYDRRDGTYVDVGELPGDYTYWNGARATLLADGRILYCGGVGLGGKALALTGIYDPVRGLFSPGPMVAARSGHTATLLLDGSVLIVGGSSGRVLASAELFQLEPAAP